MALVSVACAWGPMARATDDTGDCNACAVAGAGARERAFAPAQVRLPPPLTLHYEVTHGLLRGAGELTWRPQAQRYELTLQARVGPLLVLTQSSRGALNASGLLPSQYSDQRLRRTPTVATFERGSGQVTFSDRSTPVALSAGAQDRLSWMVQLAAIVGANPQLGQAGARIPMAVVGSKGEADTWVFRCLGMESADAGDVSAGMLKFVRESQGEADEGVLVWLDPRRHHLPVRATQGSGRGEDGFELRLREVVPVA